MLHQGKLKNWDPTKGSGFLQTDKTGPDIGISSSGFRQKPNQLQDGDSIFFQIEFDSEDKAKAVMAYKAGQRFAPAPVVKKSAMSSLPFQHLLSVLVTLSVLTWLGYQSVYLFSVEAAQPIQVSAEDPDVNATQSQTVVAEYPVALKMPAEQLLEFQCEGKQHCSEMSSCDEAKFYLKNCPNVLIDGDNDGRPCEKDCGHGFF